MKFTLIAVLLMISGAVLSSALSCFNLKQKAGKGNLCYIQENADMDKELVGSTSNCTDDDIKQGTTANFTNGQFCYMAVLRGTASAPAFNVSTNTSTTVTHSVVLVERGAVTSGQVPTDCFQQCKYIESIEDIGNTAPMNRTLLYFACGNKDNSNGNDATSYKSRTDKFNCDSFKFTQTAVTSKLPLWLIIVIAIIAAALVILIIVAVVIVCVRRKKAQPPGAHPNAAYRAQQNADESAAAVNS